jgi:D-alanine-D-alanine ligase
MRIGLSFDMKVPGTPAPAGVPDDLYEEYDPPQTVASIEGAIAGHGHEVVRLGGGRDFLEKVLSEPVDFVFNLSEGRGTFRSREGQVPSVLEMLGIPYSFSDPLTLSISLDKPLTKRMVAAAGVAAAPDWLVRNEADLEALARQSLPYPLFAKPAYEGSSKGIRQTSRMDDERALRRVVAAMLEDYRQPVMVEGFVFGDEYTVGVLGNGEPAVLGAMRIRPRAGADPGFVYSIEVKRDWENLVAYDVPAPLEPDIMARLSRDAVAAFRAIGCRDLARVDFRVNDGRPVFLEINPLPGLSPAYGDLPILARGMGVSYEELMGRILRTAFNRCGLQAS